MGAQKAPGSIPGYYRAGVGLGAWAWQEVVLIISGSRRWALGTAAGSLAVGLCSACAAPIFSKGAVVRSLPKLTVLAAYPGSSSTKTPEPAWLAPLRAAVDHLNATQRDQLGVVLDLHTFTADQAPGSLTFDSNGQVKSFTMTTYDTALASAVAEQADLLVTTEGGGLGALTHLDHAKALAALDGYLARERAAQMVDYYPGALELGRVAGRQVALPLQVQPWLMRYDAALYHAIGLAPPAPDKPWTWQQIINTAPKLAKRNPQTGANVRWACRVETVPVEVPIWQAGGDIVNAQNAVVLDQPAAIQGVTFWRDLEVAYRLDAPNTSPPRLIGDHTRPYAIPTLGGGFAAATFEPITRYGYALANIGKYWDDGLGFAPIPAGAPGGNVPVTKLDLELAGAVAAHSRQPDLAFAALRALEQALGPALLLSAIRPLAAQRLKDSSVDPRLATALRWGMAVGRASGADALGADALLRLDQIFPGLPRADAPGLPPAQVCADVAKLLRYRQVCGPVPAYCPAATP